MLRLNSTQQKGTLERVLKRYARYELLIIDEIGYLSKAMTRVYYFNY